MKAIVTCNDQHKFQKLGYEIFWPGLAEAQQLDAAAFDEVLERRARQVTTMMQHIQQKFYMAPPALVNGGLGLKRIDTDPPPDVNDAEHLAWRRERLMNPARRMIGAYELDASGKEVHADSALVGMAIFEQSTEDKDTVELVELDVHQDYRRASVADIMMGMGLHLLKPNVVVELSVSETNWDAWAYYAKRGFVFDTAPEGGLASERHGVFDTEHLVMLGRAGEVQTRLEDVHHRIRPSAPLYPVELPESAVARFQD